MEQKEYERIQAMNPAEFGKLPDEVKFAVMQHARELLNASSRMSELARKLSEDSAVKAVILDNAKKIQVASMTERKMNRIQSLREEIAELESDIQAIERQFPNVKNWRSTFKAEIDKLFVQRKADRDARKNARVEARARLVKELQELAAQTAGMVNPSK